MNRKSIDGRGFVPAAVFGQLVGKSDFCPRLIFWLVGALPSRPPSRTSSPRLFLADSGTHDATNVSPPPKTDRTILAHFRKNLIFWALPANMAVEFRFSRKILQGLDGINLPSIEVRSPVRLTALFCDCVMRPCVHLDGCRHNGRGACPEQGRLT
jgi:hypothetical protein